MRCGVAILALLASVSEVASADQDLDDGSYEARKAERGVWAD
jgi:hypothetical protein